jgi:hypothetical protein
MPNFSRYEVRLDGSAWEKVEPEFEWHLEPGGNVIEARAVNVFGREGRATKAKVFRR